MQVALITSSAIIIELNFKIINWQDWTNKQRNPAKFFRLHEFLLLISIVQLVLLRADIFKGLKLANKIAGCGKPCLQSYFRYGIIGTD